MWYSWSLRPLHTRKVPGSNPGMSTGWMHDASEGHLSEWLRSSTRNRLGLARTGSSPVVPEGGRALHKSMHIFTPSASRALFTGFDSQGVTFSSRHVVRAVKELDSKSIGLCPRRFESCTCRERPPPGFSSVGRAVDCSGVHTDSINWSPVRFR